MPGKDTGRDNPAKDERGYYPEEFRREVVLYAISTSSYEAATSYNVNVRTVKRWRRDKREADGKSGSYGVGMAAAEAHDVAVERASTQIYVRIMEMSDELYKTAEKAIQLTQGVLKSAGIQGTKEDSAWLKSLVGTFGESIAKAQLLRGKPTARPEVITDGKTELAEAILEKHPELLDSILQLTGQDPRNS